MGYWGAHGRDENRTMGLHFLPLQRGKSVLLDSCSVHLRVKIEIRVEFVVHLWIYVFLSEMTLLFLALLIWRG